MDCFVLNYSSSPIMHPQSATLEFWTSARISKSHLFALFHKTFQLFRVEWNAAKL